VLLLLGELEVKDGEGIVHVGLGLRAAQGDNAYLSQVTKQDLRGGSSIGGGEGDHCRVSEEVGIGAQGPETLVDDRLSFAIGAYVAIVAGVGIEAILQDRGSDTGGLV
jgi:hypothetical protein